MTVRALLLLLPLLAACRTPGTITVMIPTLPQRLDVAVAERFRVPLDRRRELLETIVVTSRGVRDDGPVSGDGRVLLRDADYNAWTSEFERELVRRDVQVVEQGGRAALQVSLLEVRRTPRTIDLRAHRLRRRVDDGLEPIDAYVLDEFTCRVDARIVLHDGALVWSAELLLPATSLLQPDGLVLFYRVDDLDPDNLQVLSPAQPTAPNPYLQVRWEEFVADLTQVADLPPTITDASPELVRALLKLAARRTVAEVFHADLPPGEPGGF